MPSIPYNVIESQSLNGSPTLPDSGNAAHRIPKRGALPTSNGLKPPITAKNLTPRPDSGLFLDYLRGTIPPLTFQQVTDYESGEVVVFARPNQEAIESLFGEMTLLGYSASQGYNQSASLPCGGTVHWHTTQPEQRVLINLGGEALAQLGTHPLKLMQQLDPLDFQVTRMDWAKDDTTGLLDLDLIRRKLRRGEVATRFEKWGSNESGIIGQNEAEGETLYIGNRKSESFVRCYDKAAESAAKDGTEVDGPWIRVELEIKKRKAQELWRQILDTHRAGGYVAALVLGLILGLVDFKEPGPDSNKWRWESCSWWLEFLGVGQKVKITVPKPDITLARAKNWLNLIAPTVAIVNEVDPAFLAEALTGGKSKWRPRHKAKLAQWQHEHKTDKEPFDRINEALKALREAEALKALIVARPPSQAGRHWVCQPPG